MLAKKENAYFVSIRKVKTGTIALYSHATLLSEKSVTFTRALVCPYSAPPIAG